MQLLEPQFVVCRGCLDDDGAKDLLAAVVAMVGAQGKPLRDYGNYVKLLSIIVGPGLRYTSWDDVPGRPAALAERLTAMYQQTVQGGSLPLRQGQSYNVGLIEVLAFRKDGLLERHIDHVRGVAVIVSLGATANFFYRTPRNEGDVLLPVRNGDGVLFNSAQSAAIEHGIYSFEPETKPSWFQFDDFVRVCVQFRQTFD